jgi:hypothetical protein
MMVIRLGCGAECPHPLSRQRPQKTNIVLKANAPLKRETHLQRISFFPAGCGGMLDNGGVLRDGVDRATLGFKLSTG